jgi:hypothetical protein
MALLSELESARLRYSVSLVRQGKHSFYTLTMPSDVLARTCVVSTRKEDPKQGFQRTLDEKRAAEIAQYIDKGLGTIPNSIVLSAQPAAQLKIIGRGKTLEFSDAPGAFLILDGQHRVFGLFPTIAQRVHDKFDSDYSSSNFSHFLTPIFSNLPLSKLESPGTSWVVLRDYLEKRLRNKAIL